MERGERAEYCTLLCYLQWENFVQTELLPLSWAFPGPGRGLRGPPGFPELPRDPGDPRLPSAPRRGRGGKAIGTFFNFNGSSEGQKYTENHGSGLLGGPGGVLPALPRLAARQGTHPDLFLPRGWSGEPLLAFLTIAFPCPFFLPGMRFAGRAPTVLPPPRFPC